MEKTSVLTMTRFMAEASIIKDRLTREKHEHLFNIILHGMGVFKMKN